MVKKQVDLDALYAQIQMLKVLHKMKKLNKTHLAKQSKKRITAIKHNNEKS